MEDTGKMLHEDHDLVIHRIYTNSPRGLVPNLNGVIERRLSISRLRAYSTALSAAVFRIRLEGQTPHQT